MKRNALRPGLNLSQAVFLLISFAFSILSPHFDFIVAIRCVLGELVGMGTLI
jgi:hypothetical protein